MLTPDQIKERMGSRYPWPLRDTFVPTVFEDCISWEQQVLWLYRFTLGVYLELQEEGYIPRDDVVQGSDAVVTSNGIYEAIAALQAAISAELAAFKQETAESMASLKESLETAISALNAQLTEDMQGLREELKADMQMLTKTVQGMISSLNERVLYLENNSAMYYQGIVSDLNGVPALTWKTTRSKNNVSNMDFTVYYVENTASPYAVLFHKDQAAYWRKADNYPVPFFYCSNKTGMGAAMSQTIPAADYVTSGSSHPFSCILLWGNGAIPTGDWTPDGAARVVITLEFNAGEKRLTGCHFQLPDELKNQPLPDFFGVTDI